MRRNTLVQAMESPTAELSAEARAALVKAAQSARFYRRVRAASEAPELPPEELTDGTLESVEAQKAVLLWEEVAVVYPALAGIDRNVLAATYKTLSKEETTKDPTTNAMDGVSSRIGGGDLKNDPNRVVGGTGASLGVDGASSLLGGVAPLIALVAAVAAFTSYSGGACDNPAPGSATARACEANAEIKRTGVQPETDVERQMREIREDSARKLKGTPFGAKD